MSRGFVILVLFPSLLLTQTLTVAHAHPGFERHHARPHFHLCAGHQHDAETRSHQIPDQDHDEDAVYLATIDVLLGGRTILTEDLAPDWLLSPAPDDRFIGVPHGSGREWSRPPPWAWSCPLYVLHLTLVI